MYIAEILTLLNDDLILSEKELLFVELSGWTELIYYNRIALSVGHEH